jgi:hypothetical protein
MIKGFIDILSNDTAVQSLIGLNGTTTKYKIFPGVCPLPDKPPYIVVRRTGKTPFGVCKGMATTTFSPKVDVIVYHKSYNSLEEIENAVIAALDFVSGVCENINFKTIQFQNSYDADYVVDWELHARVIEFEGIANEVTPT